MPARVQVRLLNFLSLGSLIAPATSHTHQTQNEGESQMRNLK